MGFLAAVVAAGFTAVACGNASGGTVPTGAACTAPGVTPTSVNLGLLVSGSGPAATSLTGFRSGIDARISVENQKGGVNGRTLAYSWDDDQSSPEHNLAAARALVEQKNAFAVVEGTTAELGGAEYLAGKRVPVVGVGPTTGWDRYPNMFTWDLLNSRSGVTSAWGDFARQQGGTRAAVLGVQSVPGAQELADALGASMRSAGITEAYHNLQVDQSTDPRTLASQIAQSGADTVTGVLDPELWAALWPALRQADPRIKVAIFPSGYDRHSLPQVGPSIAGSYVGLVITPFELNLPAQRNLLNAFASYSPEVSSPDGLSSISGWVTADMVIRGLQAAGPCLTRASFTTGLRQVHDFDGGGLIRPGVDVSKFGQPNLCLNIVRVSADGKSYEPRGTAPVCGRIVPSR
jgi:ABC-type branched-subunit amino acid transport system substrate-binding protein